MTHSTDVTASQSGNVPLYRQAASGLVRRAAAGLVGAATIVGTLLGPSAAPVLAATSPLTVTATLSDGTWLGTFASASSLGTQPCVTLTDGTMDSRQVQSLQPTLATIKTFQKKNVLLKYSTSTQATTITLSQASVPSYSQGPTPPETWVRFNCSSYTVSTRLASTTQVSCTPSAAVYPGTITCKATVSGGASTPTGTLHWATASYGQLSATDCVLSSGKCSVAYTTGARDAGRDVAIAAFYSGDALYTSNDGKTIVTVTQAM